MRGRSAWLALLCASLSSAAPALAQDAPALVLRPVPDLVDLADRIAMTLARRTGEEVIVGDAPLVDLIEAVPAGEVALLLEGETVKLGIGGARGGTYATEVDLPPQRGDAAVRAVALAIEALRDVARAGDAEREEPPPPRPTGEYTVVGDLPEPERVEAIARPTIFFRLLLGASPTRGTILIGPGAGLGLCVGPHCVVIEGDLPVLPERVAVGSAFVEYRPVNISVRVQLRSDWSDVFIPGISVGFLTRVGVATHEGTGATQTVSNLGMRATTELALRFYAPFEWVLEGGVDVPFNRATFVGSPYNVVLEDAWTPWFITSLRLRPGPR